MKGKEPTPNGAGSSEESNGSRRSEATATDHDHQARKSALLASTRSDCIRIIVLLAGEGGVQAFLKSPQPALGDLTGAQLLQNNPVELLRHLKWREARNDDFDEARVGDPDIEHFGRHCRKSQANRVLDILDQLERRSHE